MSSRNQKKAPPAASFEKYNKQHRRIPIASDDSNNEKNTNKSYKKKFDKEIDETNFMKRKAVPTIDLQIPKKKQPVTISENNTNNNSSKHLTEVIDINDTEKMATEEATEGTTDADKADVQEDHSGINKVQKNDTGIANNIIVNPYLKQNSPQMNNSTTIYSPPKVINVASNSEGDLTAVTPTSVLSPRDSVMEINLGIHPIRSNEVTMMEKKPVAIIRCAYIQTEDTQTVVFWFHEQEVDSYKCQVHLNYLINKKVNWVMNLIPFGSPVNDSGNPLYFCYNNERVMGRNGRLGMRLFHYVVKHPFQTLENMKATACAIKRRINDACKSSQLVIDDRKFFYFNKSCVWSSLTSLKECLFKLKRETSDCYNDEANYNPYFWQKHEKIIRKYFFSGKLNVDLSQKFNAPLVELDPSIERTSELLWQVEHRLNNVALSHEIDYEFLNSSNNDPVHTLNYKVRESEDLINCHKHDNLISNDLTTEKDNNKYSSKNIINLDDKSTNDPMITQNNEKNSTRNQASICNDPTKAPDAAKKDVTENDDISINNIDNLRNDVTNYE
jgi:hypothetical protein